MIAAKPKLYWCPDCRSLSEGDWRMAILYPTCRRSRGEVGRSTCYGTLRNLQGHLELVEAIYGAYEIGGWPAAVALWQEAGSPRL